MSHIFCISFLPLQRIEQIFSNRAFVLKYVVSCFSHVWFFATLKTSQAPLFMGFSQQEYWSGLPCPLQGIFPIQGLNPNHLGLLYCRPILYRWATREAYNIYTYINVLRHCLAEAGKRALLSAPSCFSQLGGPGLHGAWLGNDTGHMAGTVDHAGSNGIRGLVPRITCWEWTRSHQLLVPLAHGLGLSLDRMGPALLLSSQQRRKLL